MPLTGDFALIEPQDLTPQCFERAEETADALFYEQPRKVVHIDEGAIAALTSSLAPQPAS